MNVWRLLWLTEGIAKNYKTLNKYIWDKGNARKLFILIPINHNEIILHNVIHVLKKMFSWNIIFWNFNFIYKCLSFMPVSTFIAVILDWLS